MGWGGDWRVGDGEVGGLCEWYWFIWGGGWGGCWCVESEWVSGWVVVSFLKGVGEMDSREIVWVWFFVYICKIMGGLGG